MSSPPQGFSPKVLFATSECAPLVKTGGLGDVSAALPAALAAAGANVCVLLPGYREVLEGAGATIELARLFVLGHRVRIFGARLPSGVPVWIVDSPSLYLREGGGPYQTDAGPDWEDNALRFGVLSKVAAVLGSDASPVEWRPDVVHCNDWPTALAPVHLRFASGRRSATLLTIHNLAFQGVFPFPQAVPLELPPQSLSVDGIEFYGQASFLKGGIVCAEAVNTVSPTYAREIQTRELGFGLDGALRALGDRLHGVLNGIDTAIWDPETDPFIASNYGRASLEKKAPNKTKLRARMGLEFASDRPLAGMVTRLTQQKGIDLVINAADALVEMGLQVAVVGTGERELVDQLEAVARRHPENFAVFVGFDESLAHLVEAGSDMFLMPSRFEPCGMNQMYSQRYGTPPVANATGGLADTIADDDVLPTGFLMDEATVPALVATVRRALAAYRDPIQWRAIQLNGMDKDLGWTRAAQEYLEIYGKIIGVRL